MHINDLSTSQHATKMEKAMTPEMIDQIQKDLADKLEYLDKMERLLLRQATLEELEALKEILRIHNGKQEGVPA
jgi:hypothetical protein